ncbi:MAG TPA: hypothetical protein VGB14_06260 [Acidimicrobiales bacterium]|jgi:hypothetical protein
MSDVPFRNRLFVGEQVAADGVRLSWRHAEIGGGYDALDRQRGRAALVGFALTIGLPVLAALAAAVR